MSLTGVHPFLHFTVRAHLSVFQKFGFVTHPRSSLPLSHQTPLSRTQATHGFSHFFSHKILSSSFLLFHFAPSTNEEEASWKTTTKTKTKTKRTKTEESRRRRPPPPPRIVSPFLFRSLLLCVKSQKPVVSQSTKKQRCVFFLPFFFCSLLFCVFPFFSFFFFFSFFRVIRVVFCVFFPTYKKTSLSPLLCYYTFERRRRRRRKTMEAPSTSDFEEEEDEAEIAERGARAWHFFSRRVCIFRFVVANTHAREEREQSVMSLLRVRERRRSNPALVGVVQCKLSLSLSFEFTSAAVPFPSNAFRFCDRRRIAMRAHKKGARVVLNGTRRTRFPKERKEQSRRRM